MLIFHLSDDECPDAPSLYSAADVLVTTGDLRSYCVSWLRDIPEPQRKPAFGVYGNHCVPGYLPYNGIENLHHQVVQFGGMSWGGFQGCPIYKAGIPFVFSEEEAAKWADCFSSVDILLLHAPPQDMLDDSDKVHRGSAAVRRYVLEHKPKVVFAGHLYSHAMMTVGQTTLYRTYGGRLIEI